MNRPPLLLSSLVVLLASALPLFADPIPTDVTPIHPLPADVAEPMQTGPFEPTWKSLAQYETPEWFRDAKFGIWAHWGPQCEPEQGDWYARLMYAPGQPDYDWQVAHYGHPSKFGFKDVIHRWHAENWDPEKLVALYARAGAQYFFALANHHDNFDLWDSKYQPWNSLRVGPHKDLIAGWAAAARRHHLKFGVSVHAAHAWSWYETAQAADATGPLAGVPYDGKLTKADGKGQWWDGLDPQDLYAQDHAPSPNFADYKSIWSRWNWDNGVSLPDADYCEKFYNRTLDLINRYHPDLIYFDDTALPLWPVSDAGLRIAAHFYNTSIKEHGKLEGVLFGKVLNDEESHCMTRDIERGHSNAIEPEPWQSDTCIGDWHYRRSLYLEHRYKTPATVIHTLADVVAKNGNLLLNIPVRGDGTIDDDELSVVEHIAAWMDVNRESIFGTRPWKIFGEGPATEGAPIQDQGFNEGKGKPFTAEDVRFTTKGGAIYAIVLGVPTAPVAIKSLGHRAHLLDGGIGRVELLGHAGDLAWQQTDDALVIQPVTPAPADYAIVYRITPQ
ncbi:MAG TPA: alpha-L-fucosidase [Opitutus sp.]|nr:alpha-L-fucosidase [Opitutus sp.]